jgi:tRNA (cytidine/uridine-2'-O-)-methyltransferase
MTGVENFIFSGEFIGICFCAEFVGSTQSGMKKNFTGAPRCLYCEDYQCAKYSHQIRAFMFDIILFTPQIPPNTGNIIRLCANTGARLHLIRPLGFTLDEKAVRRAGLDYHDMAHVRTYDSFAECITALGPTPIYAVTKFATRRYDEAAYNANCAFLFGAETTGLPADIHDNFDEDHKIHLPMLAGNRSLNLANAVSIVVYEAWRQCGFADSVAGPHPEDFT